MIIEISATMLSNIVLIIGSILMICISYITRSIIPILFGGIVFTIVALNINGIFEVRLIP